MPAYIGSVCVCDSTGVKIMHKITWRDVNAQQHVPITGRWVQSPQSRTCWIITFNLTLLSLVDVVRVLWCCIWSQCVTIPGAESTVAFDAAAAPSRFAWPQVLLNWACLLIKNRWQETVSTMTAITSIVSSVAGERRARSRQTSARLLWLCVCVCVCVFSRIGKFAQIADGNARRWHAAIG